MIAIIDYGMGNLQSISNAFELLGENVTIVNDPSKLRQAKAIILPGVGAFGDGIKNLQERGFIPVLQEEVIEKKKPYLGVCLGLQFLAKTSEEHGIHQGLGWINGEVKHIKPNSQQFKIPHIGWNEITFQEKTTLFDDLGDKETFYFVHSYALSLAPEEADTITSTCWHGTTITASIQKGNIFGVQFHPEKSQGAGLKVLENFCKYVHQQQS